jgi:hypothetical protein
LCEILMRVKKHSIYHTTLKLGRKRNIPSIITS